MKDAKFFESNISLVRRSIVLGRACLFDFEGFHLVNACCNILYRRHLARLDVCATRPFFEGLRWTMSPSDPRIETFTQFWPFYVAEHSQPATRWLHFAGTLGATATIIFLVASRRALFIPLAFVYGYGLAWIGHFFIEKNRPATFKYPLWSFRADYKMCGFMLAGKMNAEVRKVLSKKTLSRDELL